MAARSPSRVGRARRRPSREVPFLLSRSSTLASAPRTTRSRGPGRRGSRGGLAPARAYRPSTLSPWRSSITRLLPHEAGPAGRRTRLRRRCLARVQVRRVPVEGAAETADCPDPRRFRPERLPERRDQSRQAGLGDEGRRPEQPPVTRAVHLAHFAASEEIHHLVRNQPCPRPKRHRTALSECVRAAVSTRSAPTAGHGPPNETLE